MATYIYYGTGVNAGGFAGVTTGSGPIKWSAAFSGTPVSHPGNESGTTSGGFNWSTPLGSAESVSDIYSQAAAGMSIGFKDAFRISGSSIRQPTPYVSISEEPIHGGRKQTQNTSISIAGQLTGLGYDKLVNYEDQIIENFHGQFEPFVIVEDGEVIFARDYVKVESINFDTNKHSKIVDYSISLTATNFDQVPNALDRFVKDTADKISFSDNGDGTASMSHQVSAKGVMTSSANYGSAFSNAQNWCMSRAGWDKQVYPSYVEMSANPVLIGKSESRDVLNGAYSLSEEYIYNTNGAAVDQRSADSSHPTFSKPITTISASHKTDPLGDFNEVSLSIRLQGGQSYTVDQLREYVKADQFWVPGLDSSDYKTLSELASGLSPETIKPYINRHPVSISIDEPVTDGTAERASELKINAVFSTDSLFGTDEDSVAGFATTHTSKAYLDYDVSHELDYVTKITQVTLNGRIVTRSMRRGMNQEASEALLTWAKTTYGSLEAWLYNKAKSTFVRSVAGFYCWELNPKANSLSIQKNPFNGQYEISASFDNKDWIKSDTFPNASIKNLFWTIDVKPSLPHYERIPSMSVNGYHLMYDINTIKRENIAIALNAEYNKDVGLKAAKKDIVAYNYSNYFYLNESNLGFLTNSTKNIMMKTEGMTQNEVEGAVMYKVSYSQEWQSFTIPKVKTIIKGGYVN